MCVVSSVGDRYTSDFPQLWPQQPWKQSQPEISRSEFEELKRQVEEMRRELIDAKRQDEAEGNPDCEMEDKVALLKEIAKVVGVDLSEVWPEEEA